MLRGILSFRKYLVLGAVAAAPIMGAGCSNTQCTTVKPASPCAAPAGYRVVNRAPARAPVAIAAAPVVMNAGAPVVYEAAPTASMPVYVAGSGAAPVAYDAGYAGSGNVTYKPIPSRNLAAALANVDTGSLAATNSGLVSSVMSTAEYAAMTYPTAAPVSYPTAGVSYPAATVSYPAASYPAGGYVVAEQPAVYGVPVATGVNPVQPRRGGRRGQRPVQVESAVVGIPNGTPVYITPGGTPVSAYVPAPASGTYLNGAAPTGYLPVTERRGPNDAVVHYATRSICKYDPARGEDCVWTSGF